MYNIKKSITGTNNVIIEDAANEGTIGFEFGGNSYQNTTTGKNLFIASAGSTSSGNLTLTKNADGSFTLNGTNGNSTYWYRLNSNFTLAAGTYTLSNSNANVSVNSAIFYDDNHNFDYDGTYSHNISTKTFSSSVTIAPYIRVAANASLNNFTIYPMIESGSNYNGFEPYTGQKPSPNSNYPQEIIKIQGYNIFSNSFNNLFNKLSYNTNTGIYTASDSDTASSLTYKIQQWSGTSGSTYISGTEVTKTITSTGIVSFTGTIVNNAQYIRIGNNGASTEFSLLIPISSTGLKVGDTFTLSLNLIDITIGSSKFKNIQIEKGTTASEYLPYNNIGVNILGKNLLNRADFYRSGTNKTDLSTGVRITITNSGNYRYTAFTIGKNELLGKTITINSNITASANNSPRILLFMANSSSRAITQVTGIDITSSGSATVTLPNSFATNTDRFNLLLYGNTDGTGNVDDYVDYTNLQVEIGTSYTGYKQYVNITTPIDLKGNFLAKLGNYKDEINVDNYGNVILTKRIRQLVLTGSENNWSDWNNKTNTIGVKLSNVPYLINIGNTDTSNVVMSNYFIKANSQDALYSQDIEGIATTSSNLYFRINKTNASSLANFKTWMSTHNIITYYVMTTPYNVNLGNISLFLNEGTNYITFLTGLDIETTIEYETDTSEFREKSYSGESNYRANLTIYHNNVANVIDMSQIGRITIKDPIIDTTSQIFYLGSFIAKSLTIKFKNLNGIEIASGDKVTLDIGQLINNEYIDIPIGEFYVDELAENYQTTCEIVCNDASVKFKQAVDYSSCFTDNKATIDTILQEICRICGVPLGKFPQINGNIETGTFNTQVSGKQWISYIAELKGCNAKIDRYGRLVLIPLKQSSNVSINALESESLDLGEKYSISQVRYYNGSQWVESPTNPENNDNVLYIRNDNPFITDNTTLDNIYNLIGGCEIYNLKTKNYGDITLDAYDNITYTLGENSYQTLNDSTLVYEANIMTTVENKMPSKQQETTSNVILGDSNLNTIKIAVANKVDTDDYTKAEIVARINDSSSQVKIEADSIDLNGVVTANNNFKINLDGSMECTGATINNGIIHLTDNGSQGAATLLIQRPNSYNYIFSDGIAMSRTENNITREITMDAFGDLTVARFAKEGTTLTETHAVTIGYDFIDVYDVTANKHTDISPTSIYTEGNLTVLGTKNRAVQIKDKLVKLNAYETAKPYFGDIGSNTTDNNGYCKIEINEDFMQTIESDYKVFIQECGEGNLWVKKYDDYFEVKGTPNLDFDYEIKGVQKGYADTYLEEFEKPNLQE